MAAENEAEEEDSITNEEEDTETNESSDTSTENVDDVTAIVEASILQETLTAIGALVDECKIHLDEEGLVIRAVDAANVGMVDLRVSPDAFEAYNPTGSVIGVNLERLSDIAGMAESDGTIAMELNEEIGKLNIKTDGLTYNLALIDPDSIREEPDVPDLDLPAEVVIEVNDLDRGITAADMVSDHISLSVSEENETFHIAAEGDTDDVDLNLERDDLIDLQEGEANSLYSLEYLKDMVNSMPSDAAVTLDLGEEFPVKLHFDFAEGAGNVTYMLAPRIQSD